MADSLSVISRSPLLGGWGGGGVKVDAVAGDVPLFTKPCQVGPQLFARDACCELDCRALLWWDWCAVLPKGYGCLRHAHQVCERVLANLRLFPIAVYGVHASLSARCFHCQQPRSWPRQMALVKMREMKVTPHKRNVTHADKAAAARLKEIWDAMPRTRRPTQEAMAQRLGGSSQSLTSQYLNGKISLNYKAVLAFADALRCAPELIRDDLPEQLMVKAVTPSQSLRQEVRRLVARRDELGLSDVDVHSRMQAMSWPDGVSPPSLTTVKAWFEGTRRPMDMTYRAMLYQALGMGGENDVPIIEGVATTELGAQLLRLAETGSPDEAAQMLALWTTMRKGHADK